MRIGIRRIRTRTRTTPLALLIASTSAIAACVVGCSTTAELEHSATSDAGADSASTPGDDARAPDAGPFDGGPRAIVCTSAPCARALVASSPTFYDETFCALLDDGTVACWGQDTYGRLGRGPDSTLSSAVPARVVGLAKVARLEHSCALDTDGASWCWGMGPYLQDEAGALTTERTPVKLPIGRATRLSVGADIGCALVSERLLCWGRNSRGQIAPFDVESEWATLPPREIALPPGAPIRDLVVGEATFVLREDGTTLSWGANPLLARVSSLMPDPYPKPMLLEGVSAIERIDLNACAPVFGIGYCWGQGTNGDIFARALPAPVVAPEPIVQISTRGVVRWCAVGASGNVYCQGDNEIGQAGDGTREYATNAVKVVGLPGPAVSVKTTGTATCALLTSGKIFCWGSNFYGQLGNRKFKVPSATPEEVVLP